MPPRFLGNSVREREGKRQKETVGARLGERRFYRETNCRGSSNLPTRRNTTFNRLLRIFVTNEGIVTKIDF